jgi:hypothetical protein
MLIGHPEDVRRLSVYQYHFLDDLSFVRKPEEVFDESKQTDLDAYIDKVRQHFKDAGWEGDGQIGIIWLPPFVDAGGVEDTWGTYIWHVKQSNNGTSWLASDAALDFDRLGEQNERWPSDTHVRTGIMFTACIGLTRQVKQIMSDLTRRVKALEQVSDPVFGEIKEELLITTQGKLVAQLNYFLDDSYLEVLMDVLKNGNTSALPLGKFKASFNPKVYMPTEGDSERDDPEAGQWFTIQGLIRDIWWSYKFEPFDSKTSMLFKACEYLPPQEIQREIIKHVLLRNCVQHHERGVTTDALRRAGVAEFTVVQDDGSVSRLGPSARASFSLAELANFSDSLVKLAVSFDEHTRKRIRTITWVPRSFAGNHKEN